MSNYPPIRAKKDGSGNNMGGEEIPFALGDLLYGTGVNTVGNLTGNITAVMQVLTQTGDGTHSAVPAWHTLAKADVGLSAVENTALSTWNGSSNLSTIGTITSGIWHGSAIGIAYLSGVAASGANTDITSLNAPALGAATATTATAGTSTTQLATTAFVANSYAPLASPGLTGTPTAPTASTGDSSTAIATTAFVQATVIAIPQNSQSAAYTLVLADAGKHILHPAADTTARTFTLPANSAVAYPLGTTISFINQNAAGTVTIAINTDTMRLAGAGTTGSRTLAANGYATATKITSTEWIIGGAGLT